MLLYLAECWLLASALTPAASAGMTWHPGVLELEEL